MNNRFCSLPSIQCQAFLLRIMPIEFDVGVLEWYDALMLSSKLRMNNRLYHCIRIYNLYAVLASVAVCVRHVALEKQRADE
jgi:hypothetical protein